jgi:glycosyltransferase involved in cell wall biosynthesis
MPALALLKYNTSPEVEWLIIDNGSTDPIERYIRTYIKPKRLNYVRNEDNVGLIKNAQFAYENTDSDILTWIHADCFIYEKDWDKKIESYFREMPDLGVVGLMGSQGCLPNGGRIQDVDYPEQQSGWSNMVEAEIHGKRLKEPYHACAIFDNFFMAFSRKMLNDAGGFELGGLKYHHYHDRWMSLESLRLGYKNIVSNIYCHHVGNIAASTPLYQQWQERTIGNATDSIQIHEDNKKLFMDFWGDCLPLYLEDDFSFRTGNYMGMEFKGNKIVGYQEHAK